MSNRIQELREERNWKQNHLATKLNVTAPTISKYESGKLQIPQCYLETLSNLFNVSIDYLLCLSPYRNEFATETVSKNNIEDTVIHLFRGLSLEDQEYITKELRTRYRKQNKRKN